MIDARAGFQSQLRDAVRAARGSNELAPPPRMMAARRSVPLRAERRTAIRLWLPLTPLWIVLAPFALILSPLLMLAPQLRGIRPIPAAWAIGRMLLALSGTEVDVHAPDARVHVTIY
jgi:hypothetical protein